MKLIIERYAEIKDMTVFEDVMELIRVIKAVYPHLIKAPVTDL